MIFYMIPKINFHFLSKKYLRIGDFKIHEIRDEYNNIRKHTIRLLFIVAFLIYLIIAEGYYKANYHFMMYVTFVSIFILITIFLKNYNKHFSNTLSSILFLYIPIVNIFIKDAFFFFHGDPSIHTIFLHTHFILLIFICFGGLICNHRHILIVSGISTIWICIGTICLNDSFLWSLLLLDCIFFIGISLIMYFVYSSIDHIITEVNKLGKTISIKNEELNKLLGFKNWMLNLIIHDLKNPLNRILFAGKQNIIQKEEIIESSKQILIMIENILDVSKMEESKMQLELTTEHLGCIIQKAAKQVSYMLDEKGITLIKHIPLDTTINVDKCVMERVIINLLTNAIKYSNANDTIEIRIVQTDCKVRIEVIDTGEGIKPGDIDSIFEKYYLANAKDLGYTHPTGMGLTFCKQAIEAHGGTIGAKSVLTNGTTVWFELPIKSEMVTTTEETTKISPKKHTNCHNEEMKILKDKLRTADLAIYKTGEILNILNPSTSDTPEVLYWKEEIIKSSMTGNMEYFNILTNA